MQITDNRTTALHLQIIASGSKHVLLNLPVEIREKIRLTFGLNYFFSFLSEKQFVFQEFFHFEANKLLCQAVRFFLYL